jgi:SAM-dependent methyltransferase
VEAYANLGARNAEIYKYQYHAWNKYHGYRHLEGLTFPTVLGLGSAYGDELAPILPSTSRLVIVEPSSAFVRTSVHGVPAEYVKPSADGSLPFPDDTFDLVTALGVLHHIPNVTFVVRELSRTLKPGGHMLVREPIVSMGDWRGLRPGLTKHERGIPLPILRNVVATAGLELANLSLCDFPPIQRVMRLFRSDIFNSPLMTRIDALASNAFSWNANYHPRNLLQRFRPTTAFMVLRKRFESGRT